MQSMQSIAILAQEKCPMSVCYAPWLSRVSHKRVREKAKAQSIRFLVRKKQYALLGHILRLPFDHPDRLVLFEPGTLDNRIPDLPMPDAQCRQRRRGRPRAQWADILLAPLRAHNTDTQILTLARDRSNWYSTTLRLCS